MRVIQEHFANQKHFGTSPQQGHRRQRRAFVMKRQALKVPRERGAADLMVVFHLMGGQPRNPH